MASFITDVIDIPELIGYVREAANPPGPTLAGLLPTLAVEDLEYELRNIDSPTLQIARYRAWDTAPVLGKRPGVGSIVGEIAPLGLSMRLNEKELKRLNALRAGLAGGSAQDIYDDALTCGQACLNRIELARADLLTDGVVSIVENGCNVQADFGVPGANFATAAPLWSDHAASTPVENFKAWQAQYRSVNGGKNPAAWLTSTEAINDLSLNAQIRNLTPVTGIVPGIITAETVGQVLKAQGIAPLIPFDGELPDANGTFTRLIGARKVIGVPATGLGNVFVGTAPAAELMVGQKILRREDAAGLVVYATEQITPASVTTTGEAIALPVLRNPNALFVATV